MTMTTHVQLYKSVAAIRFSEARPNIDLQLAALLDEKGALEKQTTLLKASYVPSQVALPQVIDISFYRKGKKAPKKLTGKELRLINEAISEHQLKNAVPFSADEVRQAILEWVNPPSF
jgi:hypothetical protein